MKERDRRRSPRIAGPEHFDAEVEDLSPEGIRFRCRGGLRALQAVSVGTGSEGGAWPV